MIRHLIISIPFYLAFIQLYSQFSDKVAISDDFIFGAWYDSTKLNTGGYGFIFSPDKCCNLIIDGDMTECVIESKKMKVNFSINYLTSPRQIDINFIAIETDSIKYFIPIIFEIIDSNHIKIATDINLYNRTKDFEKDDLTEISTLTRYIEKERY